VSIHPPMAPVYLTGAEVALVYEVLSEAIASAGIDLDQAATAPIDPAAPVTLSFLAARWSSVAAPDLQFAAVLDLSVGGDVLFAVPTRGEERHLLAALAVDRANRLLREHPDPASFGDETLDDQEAWQTAEALFQLADRIGDAS
jgi:hypothetical protein